MDETTTIVSARTLDARIDEVFAAFSDPSRLAAWWGPAGFTSTFERFEFEPGGQWRFVMRGPDGTDYANENRFVEVRPNERIVFRHEQSGHDFEMTITFTQDGERTALQWRMVFDSPIAQDLRGFLIDANEQNFDRLEAHLRG